MWRDFPLQAKLEQVRNSCTCNEVECGRSGKIPFGVQGIVGELHCSTTKEQSPYICVLRDSFSFHWGVFLPTIEVCLQFYNVEFRFLIKRLTANFTGIIAIQNKAYPWLVFSSGSLPGHLISCTSYLLLYND